MTRQKLRRPHLICLAAAFLLAVLLSAAVSGDDRMQIVPAIYCGGETYVELENRTFSYNSDDYSEVLGTVSELCPSDRMPVRELQTNDPSLLNRVCYPTFGDDPVGIDVKVPDEDMVRIFTSYRYLDQTIVPSVCFDGHVYMQSRYTVDDFSEIKSRYQFYPSDWKAKRCYPFAGPDEWAQGDTNYEFLLDATFYRSDLTDEIIYAVTWVHGRRVAIRFVRQEENAYKIVHRESKQIPQPMIRLNDKVYHIRSWQDSHNADGMIKNGIYRLLPKTAAITDSVGIDQVPEKEGSTNCKNLVGTTAQFLEDDYSSDFFWIERANYKGYREYLIFYPEE